MMSKTDSSRTYTMMTEAPVGPLIIRLAIPTIISMMITALYNMADTFFVSRLGTSASGAVGVIFSLMSIIQAVGFTIGMGSGSLLSRSLGKKDYGAADTYASSAFFFAFTTGCLLVVIGQVQLDRIVSHMGATPTILPYAKDYARYIILGIPFIATSFVMNNQLRFQGMAAKAMIGLTAGGILNMLLDPLFIFVLKLGIAGAAIATLISQCASFCILLSFFLRRIPSTKLSIACISRKAGTYAAIIKNGLPSFARQGIASLAVIALNRQAGFYGDAAVAGMSITNRVFMFIMAIAIGIGQGFQPVCAMNYGAQKYVRVRQAFFFMVKLCAAIMSVCAVTCFVFAPQIVASFRNDPAVILVGAAAMRFQCLLLPFHSLIFGTNMMLQTTGQSNQATFTACLRQGIYFLPLIILLPRMFGLTGIELTQAIADCLTVLTSIPFAVWFLRSIAVQHTGNG